MKYYYFDRVTKAVSFVYYLTDLLHDKKDLERLKGIKNRKDRMIFCEDVRDGFYITTSKRVLLERIRDVLDVICTNTRIKKDLYHDLRMEVLALQVGIMKKIEFYQFSGAEFCHLRKKMRFTKTEMAEMLELSLPMISLIESGKRALSPEASNLFVDVVKKYLDYKINMSVDTFLKIQLRDLKNEHTEK